MPSTSRDSSSASTTSGSTHNPVAGEQQTAFTASSLVRLTDTLSGLATFVMNANSSGVAFPSATRAANLVIESSSVGVMLSITGSMFFSNPLPLPCLFGFEGAVMPSSLRAYLLFCSAFVARLVQSLRRRKDPALPKLTKSLARTLDALKPYEGDEAFMRKVNDGESPIDGTSVRRARRPARRKGFRPVADARPGA